MASRLKRGGGFLAGGQECHTRSTRVAEARDRRGLPNAHLRALWQKSPDHGLHRRLEDHRLGQDALRHGPGDYGTQLGARLRRPGIPGRPHSRRSTPRPFASVLLATKNGGGVFRKLKLTFFGQAGPHLWTCPNMAV